jgi:hypothetical protein
MNKTQAMKTARRAVGQPQGRGTSWTIYGPYYCTEDGLRGPSTELRASTYWEARAKRAEWVCYLALKLMGWTEEEADAASCTDWRDFASIDAIMGSALRQRDA